MKSAAIVFVLLLSSIPICAQKGAQPGSGAIVLRAQPAGNANNCPISMRANQGIWDHTIKVRQGQQEQSRPPFGQRIILTLGDSHPTPIVAATVKVFGLTGRNHIVEAEVSENPNGDATKTIKLTFATNSNGAATGDLYAAGFTAVNSIELLDVSYADGRVWRIGADSVCRVAPDPMMLIASH